MLDALGVDKTALVSNDMGSLVVFSFAAHHRDHVTRWVQTEAPIPRLGPWEQITSNPQAWHFGFGGPDMERLVAGRERIYLDYFWNDYSADPSSMSETLREHYSALYALPGAIRAGFAQFNAFPKDAEDNKKYIEDGGKLNCPFSLSAARPLPEAEPKSSCGSPPITSREPSCPLQGIG